MGLAASQARLLTITSRKSRAQFENMRFSHQKLALSRKLTDLSNEYQNSLNQTKLYYDFYGVNSTDTPLTYNMLMTASSINDYTPTLITNNQGQVILSSAYAYAARAAGIPMEGLGCQPSSILRDTFILALVDSGVITQGTADAIIGVDYNQGAGLGTSNLVNTSSTYGNFETLLNILSTGDGEFCLDNSLFKDFTNSDGMGVSVVYRDGTRLKRFADTTDLTPGLNNYSDDSNKSLSDITFKELLTADSSSTNHVYLIEESATNERDRYYNYQNLITSVYNVLDKFALALGNSLAGADNAIAYAMHQMESEFFPRVINDGSNDNINDSDDYDAYIGIGSSYGKEKHQAGVAIGAVDKSELSGGKSNSSKDAEGYLGLVNNQRTEYMWFSRWGWTNPHEHVGAIDLTDTVRAWFTYFMQYMHGLGSAEANNLSVNWGAKDSDSTLATKENIGDYQFTLTSTKVSDNEALISNFYDTLFNQICINGWAENDQVDKDSNYLKEMLQNGMMYITSMSDDYYYYQNNYATNSFIKEVADDSAIAAAESKYTTEKARINAKEQEIDLKMKNLDTEISSLETEYEAVKKVIENNASKSFTRYDG